ncbi:MAG TPA: beta-ketoacyl-ACP synthase III [Phycisphaerales bacterium]|nr:beta-ketoacyl-ACP synthase III [Phycisphaerales bacterium]HMP37352.1 beta-ketoacyl-ACP synthase III [Phycisphaerales bacterium]
MTAPARGVRLVGTGSAVPERVLSNDDLVRIMDTSSEWIEQRTGILERRIVDPRSAGTYTLTRDALRAAIEATGTDPRSLDMVIVATCTGEMTCPSVACRVAGAIGAAPAGAFDLVAACSGFVYAISVADTLVRSGRSRRVAVVGCDAMSTVVDYDDRSVSILFGDAAGAAILEADDDPSVGCIYQRLQSDGSDWRSLYMPRRAQDIPASDAENPIRLGCLRMNGREVFRFAVTKFREVIEDALAASGVAVDDVSQFICHQSNIRIIDAAIERLGLPREKVYVNIDRFGNSSAGSVGLCLDQLWRAGKLPRGKPMVMVAFGGGLTWASNVWKV